MRLEREKVFETRIDSCFDSYAEDLPRLGSVPNKLTKDNGKFRREVFAHAKVDVEMKGMSWEDAIKQTVNMFKNADGENTTAKKLITKLNKQKGKFTNPPTRKKTSLSSRKFASEAERIRATMGEAYKKAGIE